MTDLQKTFDDITQKAAGLLDDKIGLVGNMANLVGLLHNELHPHWTGFYLVEDKELHLGPFQGPVACTRIPFGKGVCGQAWESKKSIIVDNVHTYPGHIACSPFSNSEIVVPFVYKDKIVAVLDIDSADFNAFSEDFAPFLENILSKLATCHLRYDTPK